MALRQIAGLLFGEDLLRIGFVEFVITNQFVFSDAGIWAERGVGEIRTSRLILQKMVF